MQIRISLSVVTLAGLLSFGFLSTSEASAPMKKTSTPGWYRTMIGDFEVTALNDGIFGIETKLLQHTSQKEIEKGMDAAFVAKGDKVPTSVNAFLVNTGTQLVLIDTGVAKAFGPTLGFAIENLKAAGYDPAQVDVVLITHMHGDHVNGLVTADGKMVFPNAQVMVTKPEAGFWMNKEQEAKAPEGMKPFFKMANGAAAPYVAAGKWKTFEPNAEPVPGIKAMATGHTPGHTSYVVESKGQKLIVLGDVIHVGAVQFGNPDVSIGYDVDDKTAIASRKKLFADAAKNKTLLAGAHLAFPGLGHVRAQGKGYTWVPVEFAYIP